MRYHRSMEASVRDSTDLVAAGLVRDFRRRSGWTQAEMSRIAGVPQSVISAYETGARQPSLGAVIRLFEACGQELRLNVVDRDLHDEVLPVRSEPGMTQALKRDEQRRLSRLKAEALARQSDPDLYAG